MFIAYFVAALAFLRDSITLLLHLTRQKRFLEEIIILTAAFARQEASSLPTIYYYETAKEDKGDKEGIPHTHPIP